MNQFVIIFVPSGQKLPGDEAGQRPEPEDEYAQIRKAASCQPVGDAEQLPLWRWFTFEKGR